MPTMVYSKLIPASSSWAIRAHTETPSHRWRLLHTKWTKRCLRTEITILITTRWLKDMWARTICIPALHTPYPNQRAISRFISTSLLRKMGYSMTTMVHTSCRTTRSIQNTSRAIMSSWRISVLVSTSSMKAVSVT